MRYHFPTRVPLAKTVAFAGVLFCVQLFEHTSLEFSILFFSFVVLSALAFNLAGGFSRPSGAYVFFFATLSIIFGVVLKALLGEAADSNLESPAITIAAYTSAMAMLLVSVLVSNRISGSASGVGALIRSDRLNLTYSAIGCMLLGISLSVLTLAGAGGSGSLLSAVGQIDFFLPLGIILATIDVVARSGGRRSVNAVSAIGLALALFIGAVTFSKQGYFTPFFAWALGAVYGGLRIRPVHVITSAIFGVLAFTVFTPLSQVGRELPHNTITGALEINALLVENLGKTREVYAEGENAAFVPGEHHGYYDVSTGLAQRLTMIDMDDSLISYSLHAKPLGSAPIRQYIENWIPHFVDPTKGVGKIPYGGNYYAHEIGGLLANSDTTTGISFSPVGELFRIDGWVGIFLIGPAVWIVLFASVNIVCGDLRRSPWGLIALLSFAHIAPEGGIGAAVYSIWYLNLGIIVAMVICVYIAPILGSLLGTSLHRSEHRTPAFDRCERNHRNALQLIPVHPLQSIRVSILHLRHSS